MNLKLNLILLLVIGFFNSAFPQDKLIKKDSVKLEVKIIEISDTEIKYKMFDNPEGPLYINPKSDFVRAEYKNGTADIFKNNAVETLEKTSSSNSSPEYKKNTSDEKIGDWIKFNIDAGIAYNESFNAIPTRLYGSDREGNGDVYSKNPSSNADHFSPYLGLNFILGKGKVLKHLLGVSYLNVKTNYNQTTGSGFTPSHGSASPPFYAQSTSVSVSGSYHILCLNSGLNFKLSKGLNLCLISSIGFVAKGTLVSNGYRIDYTTVADTVYPGTKTTSQTTLIENERSNGNSVGFFSVQAKAYYDFKIKENVLGVYLLGNISAFDRLPYCAVGLSWYPFKRLRATDL
jgi:hypothetical protein